MPETPALDLATFSTDALIQAIIRLTHQTHGQHREDTVDLRAQRDLVAAEILRRVEHPGHVPAGTPDRVNLTAGALAVHEAIRAGDDRYAQGAASVWTALFPDLRASEATEVGQALIACPITDPDVIAYVPTF